jgi:hypothetical protein
MKKTLVSTASEIKVLTSCDVIFAIIWLVTALVRNAPAKPIRIFLLNKR